MTAPLGTLIFALAGCVALWALVGTVRQYQRRIRTALRRPRRP